MKLHPVFLFAASLILSFISAIAQTEEPIEKIYKVDTITNKISGAIDFDRTFYISKDFPYKIDPGAITYSSFRKQCKAEKAEVKNVDAFAVSKKDKKTYTLLIHMPPLDPGKKHLVSIQKKLTPTELDKIIENTVIPNVYNPALLKFELVNVTDGREFVGYGGETLTVVEKEIEKIIPKLDSELKVKTAAQLALKQYITSLALTSTNHTTSLAALMYGCESCKGDTTLLFMGERVSRSLPDILSLLGKIDFLFNDMDGSIWKHVAQGNVKLSDVTSETFLRDGNATLKLKEVNTDDALSNLQATTQSLLTLSQFNDLLSKATAVSVAPVKLMIDELLTHCYGSIDRVKAVTESHQKLRDLIGNAQFQKALKEGHTEQANIFMINIFIEGGATEVYNFDTRNALQLTPEFGVVYYGINNFNPKFSGVLPYAGFHVNFRYIHRDIPFRIAPYRKTFGARFSVLVAFSLTSLEKENERKDFFNKTSLLLGAGYRLANAIRLVGGAMIFQHDDSNPLITQYTFVATPFAGVSLDLSLYDLMKGIDGIVGSLKK